MRLLNITASTLYSAGFQQGEMAKAEIQIWLAGSEMSALAAFAFNDPIGSKAFAQIKSTTSAAFPALVDELVGLSEGAEVPLDQIWVANMIAELDPLLPKIEGEKVQGHCTDVFAHSSSNGGSLHGHNEDWSEEAKPLWYYVSLRPEGDDADFVECAGLAYPGSLLAYAPAWNAHGIYQTQNTLFPNNTRSNGLACSFVQRAALCSDETTSINAYLDRLQSRGGWASGASLNLVDLNTGAMANAEVLLDDMDVFHVSDNYTHTNEFKHLEEGMEVDLREDSATHREARLSAMDKPESIEMIGKMLGDEQDVDFPVYRTTTLTSSLLDATTGCLQVWDGKNPAEVDPDWEWNIKEWFA